MKTLEQIATDLAPSFWRDESGQIADVRTIAEQAFIAGVQFNKRKIRKEKPWPITPPQESRAPPRKKRP